MIDSPVVSSLEATVVLLFLWLGCREHFKTTVLVRACQKYCRASREFRKWEKTHPEVSWTFSRPQKLLRAIHRRHKKVLELQEGLTTDNHLQWLERHIVKDVE